MSAVANQALPSLGRQARGLAVRCLAMAATAIAIAGCDRNVGTVELNILVPEGYNPLAGPDVDVLEVQIAIAGQSRWSRTMDLRSYNEGADAGSGESEFTLASFPDLPVGDGWVVSVEARSALDLSYARGRSLPFTVREGRNPVDLYVAGPTVFSKAAASDVVGTPRGRHTAVPLSNGQVALVGGGGAMDIDALRETPEPTLTDPVAAVDLFDPTSGHLVRAGQNEGCIPGQTELCLTTARLGAAIGRTPRGDVLVAGGVDAAGSLAIQIERMELGTQIFLPVGRAHEGAWIDSVMAQTPGGAAMLGGEGQDGHALQSGLVFGASGAPYQLFETLLELPRARATVGSVGDTLLLFGGADDQGIVEDCELLDVSDNVPTLTSVSLEGTSVTARLGAAAAAIDDRVVMLIGGVDGPDGDGRFNVSREIDIFVPSTGLFCNVGALEQPRYLHTVAVLPDDRVLVVGGVQELAFPRALNEGYLIDPQAILTGLRADPSQCVTLTGEPERINCVQGRIAPTATTLDNGMVLVAGGFSDDGAALASYEIYVP